MASAEANEDADNAEKELGTVEHSMLRLPVWFQLSAVVLAAVIPFVLSDFEVLSWLSKQLHFDLGASLIWKTDRSTAYYDLVSDLTIRERLGFALYAALLAAVLLLLRRVFSPPASTTSVQRRVHTDLFLHHTTIFRVVVALHVVEVFIVLRGAISAVVDDIPQRSPQPTSPIFAVDGQQQQQQDPSMPDQWGTPLFDAVLPMFLSPMGPSSSSESTAVHFRTQYGVMSLLIRWWMSSVVLPASVALLYRLSRDVWSKRVRSLTGILSNVCMARCGFAALSLCWEAISTEHRAGFDANTGHRLADPMVSRVALAVASLVTVAAVNFSYGPTGKNNNVVVAPRRLSFVASTVAIAGRCTLLSLMGAVALTMVAVGVHIVELCLLCLLTFCYVMWAPAALDCCSVELVTLYAATFVLLNESVHSDTEAKTFVAGWLWWQLFLVCHALLIALGMLHNVVSVLFETRLASSVVLLFLAAAVVAVDVTSAGGELLVEHLRRTLLNVHPLGLVVLGTGIALACATLNSKVIIPRQRERLAAGLRIRSPMTPIGVSILIKKHLRALLLVVRLAVSATAGSYFVSIVLGSWIHLSPELGRIVILVVSVAVFGALSDSTATQYTWILRASGFLDPPGQVDRENDSAGESSIGAPTSVLS